jgi:hypothetical protein
MSHGVNPIHYTSRIVHEHANEPALISISRSTAAYIEIDRSLVHHFEIDRSLHRAHMRHMDMRHMDMGGAIAAPWSAPLPKDVLTVESLGKDLDVAALGVSLSFLALLDEKTVPGWLPGLLDEQRCPLYGPISFCFTEDHGAVPIGVVRLNARCHSPHPRTRHRPPNLQPRPPPHHPTPNLQPADVPIRPAPRRASQYDGRRAGHGLRLC